MQMGLVSQVETNDKWMLYLLNNEIYFGTKSSSAGWQECFVPWTPQINTWYNLACVQTNGNCDLSCIISEIFTRSFPRLPLG